MPSPPCARAATAISQARPINIVFNVEEGPRVYIERINVRGNTRTRDYVIRREFDIARRRRLQPRAGRSRRAAAEKSRLFQDREDHHRARLGARSRHPQCRCRGAVDRRVLGLGRLFDRRRLPGRSQHRRAQLARPRPVRQGRGAVRPVYPRLHLSFVEPYFLGYRRRVRHRSVRKQQTPTSYVSYDTQTIGGGLRLGFALREDLACSCAIRSISRRSRCRRSFKNCNNINPDLRSIRYPTPDQYGPADDSPPRMYWHRPNCYADGEASLAVRSELAERRRAGVAGRLFADTTIRSTTTRIRPAAC